MLITKKCIFHYDATKAAWCGHTRYLNHDGQVCIAYICEGEQLTDFDMVHIKFEDGFTANVYPYELEEIN